MYSYKREVFLIYYKHLRRRIFMYIFFNLEPKLKFTFYSNVYIFRIEVGRIRFYLRSDQRWRGKRYIGMIIYYMTILYKYVICSDRHGREYLEIPSPDFFPYHFSSLSSYFIKKKKCNTMKSMYF